MNEYNNNNSNMTMKYRVGVRRGLVCLMGRGNSLALVGSPPSDGVTIKTPRKENLVNQIPFEHGNNQRKSSRIARRAVKKGARPSVMDQAEVEKCTIGTNSAHPQASLGHLNEETPQLGPPDSVGATNQTKKKRVTWTREEYKQVMEAYVTVQMKLSGETDTKQTYMLWRTANPTRKLNIDANKLANVRRDIIKKKRLTDAKLENIRRKVRERFNQSDQQSEDIDQQNTPSENIQEPDKTQGNQADERRASHDQQADEMYQSLSDEIQRRWEEIKHLDMEDRDPLPKITKDKNSKKLIRTGNQIIADIIDNYKETLNITSINQLAYATAAVITESIGIKLKKPKQNKETAEMERKAEKDIRYKRSDLSVLPEMEKGSKVNQRQQRRIKKKYNIKEVRDIPEVRERLKQQILAKAQRVRRYVKRGKFFRQNKLFKEDTKRLYRELGKKQVNVEEPPPVEEIEAFWSNIWENEKHHDETAEWIRQQDEKMKNQLTQEYVFNDLIPYFDWHKRSIELGVCYYHCLRFVMMNGELVVITPVVITPVTLVKSKMWTKTSQTI